MVLLGFCLVVGCRRAKSAAYGRLLVYGDRIGGVGSSGGACGGQTQRDVSSEGHHRRGGGEVGQLIARKFQQHPEYGIRLVGFVDLKPKEPRDDLEEVVLLGGIDQLPDLVARFGVDRVVIAYSNESHEELLGLIHRLKAISVHIDVVPRLFESFGPRVEMHMVEALPLIGLPPIDSGRSTAS